MIEQGGVEEARGFEGEEDTAFDGELWGFCGGELVANEFFLGVVEGAAEGELGEGFGKGEEFGWAIWGVGFGGSKFIEVAFDMLGDGDGGLGGGLIPFFGEAGAALVAEATVICGEGGADDHGLAEALWGEVAVGEGLLDAVGWLPAEFEGGGGIAEFEVLELEMVGAAADEEDVGFFLADLRPAGDPAVDEGLVAVVDPEAEAVLAADDEFVGAGVGCDDAAFEAEVELEGIEGFGDWALIAECEGDLRDAGVVFDSLFAGLAVGLEGHFFFCGDDGWAAVESEEAVFFAPVFVIAAAEVADDVGDAGAVLMGG